jgi:phage/plasmid-associated DNA primase
VRQARESYKGDMDVLAEWMEACCEVGPDFAETNTALWNSWETWARLSGGKLRLVSSRDALGRRLEAKGFASVRDMAGMRGRGRLGLRVRRAEGFNE